MLKRLQFQLKRTFPAFLNLMYVTCRTCSRLGACTSLGKGCSDVCTCGIENNAEDPGDENRPPYVINKYPWMVQIHALAHGHGWDQYYTGTLVSDMFIVTAGSIFNKHNIESINRPEWFAARPAAPEFITLTDPNSRPTLLGAQKIERIWVHPYYLRRINHHQYLQLPSDDLSYNVALFKMKDRVDFYTEFSYKAGIRPICLPKPGHLEFWNIQNINGLLIGRSLKMIDGTAVGPNKCQDEVGSKRIYRL